MPKRRHTLFFTATWPREVRKLAGEILTDPYKAMIGNRDQLKGNLDITRLVRLVEAHSKSTEVIDLLREAGHMRIERSGKALVFRNTKRMCEQHSQLLHRSGVPCASIHGDKDQMQRDEALIGLMAARGLDNKGVGRVVNYDPANNTEDYAGSRLMQLHVKRGNYVQQIPLSKTFRLNRKQPITLMLTDGFQKQQRGFLPALAKTYSIVTTGVDAGLRGEPRNVGRVAHELGGWTSSEEMASPGLHELRMGISKLSTSGRQLMVGSVRR